jgi:hypothetical protein
MLVVGKTIIGAHRTNITAASVKLVPSTTLVAHPMLQLLSSAGVAWMNWYTSSSFHGEVTVNCDDNAHQHAPAEVTSLLHVVNTGPNAGASAEAAVSLSVVQCALLEGRGPCSIFIALLCLQL